MRRGLPEERRCVAELEQPRGLVGHDPGRRARARERRGWWWGMAAMRVLSKWAMGWVNGPDLGRNENRISDFRIRFC
jgi:hypothetical protein